LNSYSRVLKHLGAVLVIAALMAGVGLRVVGLDRVPPGLYADEACNGYDAYSILLTGRDHHGNFLPLVFQGFNDNRMPLFDYSLVPLIGAFGLSPSVVRLGAALWGTADLVAVVILAALILGLPGAVVTAVLVAVSPWHLPLSRYGTEVILASTTVSLAMACFFLWLKRHEDRWLLLSGVLFGLTLYSYPITKIFTPLMLGLLTLLYWRELRQARSKALIALAIVLALAAPQAALLWRHWAEMQAHFSEVSLFHYISTCPGCSPSKQAEAVGASFAVRAADFAAAWLSYFTPDFLFLSGDRGGHWELLFPPGVGMLVPEQALLIGLALVGLFGGHRRKLAVLLIGWLVLAALPAALLVPGGAWNPGPSGQLPVPFVLAKRLPESVPLTPWLLFAHPDARHDVLAIAPWILLSALGFVTLIEWSSSRTTLKMAAVVLIVIGTIFHGARFVRSYFRDYPIIAAPYFYYGLDQVIGSIPKFRTREEPVIIDDRIAQAYIQVLFHEHYPPALFEQEELVYRKKDYPLLLHPHAQPIAFDNYFFEDPQDLSSAFSRGIFVFAGNPEFPHLVSARGRPVVESRMLPISSVLYPDGRTAYRVFYKTSGWSCSPHTSVSLKVSSDTTICSFSAATPTTGGPWRAVVTWNMIIKNTGSEGGSIECRLSNGTSNMLAAHARLPNNDYRYWNTTISPSGTGGVYGNNIRTTWTWHCEAQSPSTVLPGPSPHGNSYAQVYFVPALKNNDDWGISY
jgi:4-amino-4-deoxy-L-arabinose transferase-like glycosyltransferase